MASKTITSAGVWRVNGRDLKVYLVSREPWEPTPQVVAAAQQVLAGLVPAPDEDGPPAGWVILHRAAVGVFVNAYSWVWGNVVEFTGLASAIPALGTPDDDESHFVPMNRPWIGCIWELAPLDHERRAWIRHVFDAEVADLDAYLADRFPDGLTE